MRIKTTERFAGEHHVHVYNLCGMYPTQEDWLLDPGHHPHRTTPVMFVAARGKRPCHSSPSALHYRVSTQVRELPTGAAAPSAWASEMPQLEVDLLQQATAAVGCGLWDVVVGSAGSTLQCVYLCPQRQHGSGNDSLTTNSG